MNWIRTLALLTFCCLCCSAQAHPDATATGRPYLVDGQYDEVFGGNRDLVAGAVRDTIYLCGPWGSGAPVNGQFEDPAGNPAWNGWTSFDTTQRTESAWHVDTYNVVEGAYSAYCGDPTIPSCGEDDPAGGYGWLYDEWLTWTAVVEDPGIPTTVHLTATVNHDTEPAYDYSHLGFWKDGQDIAYLWTVDGEGEQVPIDVTVTYQPGEYVGESGDEIKLTWRVTSDGGWDDLDCSYYGDGALQIDDITVAVDHGGTVETIHEDFEDCGPLGTLGDHWFVEFPPGVGDYSHIRAGLDDLDACRSNTSPVACFIADDLMLAERGLPSQLCINWCYGPGGYIVNTQGGLMGEEGHLYNEIHSPVIPWPVGDYDGVRFSYDVYRHEDLTADSPGIFYAWGIRSTTSTDPADILDEAFQDRDSGHYYGGPDWIRYYNDVTDLVHPDRRWAQIQLLVKEDGYYWGWDGDDGYPAPYFDNVQLVCFRYEGPGMRAREIDLAQDAFPTAGQIHTGASLGLNDVRFDMANNIALATDLRNDPGDSVVADIAAQRSGSSLVTEFDGVHGPPALHFVIRLNPVFDASLRLGAGPFTVNPGTDGELTGEITDDGSGDGVMRGFVRGNHAYAYGQASPDRWQFDLPDQDLLYPGDVLHYYIEAWDEVDGDFANAFLPADRTGYGDFSHPLTYDSSFTVRALPTLLDDAGAQPEILFWNDFANRGGQDEWHGALDNLGLRAGLDYDVYYTNGPSSGVGNGLGGRAAYGQIDGYATMLYTCGDLGVYTISNLDYRNDAGDDVGLLDDWLAGGDRHLLATGDDLVHDLRVYAGATTAAFLDDWMQVQCLSYDARPLLGGETSPQVFAAPGNPVFQNVETWLAYGGCPVFSTFDAITADGAERLAVFGDDASGLAAVARTVAANGSMVITLPYDLMRVRTPKTVAKAGQPAALPARALLLQDVLASFGHDSFGPASGAPLPAAAFAASAAPNPFNPAVKISYRMPAAGRLTLRIFDVRGRRVRTLFDGPRPAGEGFVRWDGRDDAGLETASGVYFYEAVAAGKERIGKLMLLK